MRRHSADIASLHLRPLFGGQKACAVATVRLVVPLQVKVWLC